MNSLAIRSSISRALIIAAFTLLVVFIGIIFAVQTDAATTRPAAGERLITIHDRNHERSLLTDATTLRAAFKEASIELDPNDRVEPSLDAQLVASHYEVNVYRARPVTIVDGSIRQKVMSSYRTPKQIAEQAQITLQDEDEVAISASTNMVEQGAGVQLTISRATPFTLVLYGTKTEAYSQQTTIAEMLKEKNITLAGNDTLNVPTTAELQAGMVVELWRNGKQTATEEQDVPFDIEKIRDADQPVGYSKVTTPGEVGKKTVTYEVEMKNGVQVNRVEIQSVVTKESKKQIEVIGVKPSGNGLTKSKGVMNFTDSKGVVHRETYYDLPMNKVMGSCRGSYSVRADGVKVDQDGYVIIAANLGNYPRCSLVETSLGTGKVYDTGGFASVHPHGFDLATDWTNNDGI